MDRQACIRKLRELIQTRVVVLDGAVGTGIQDLNLSADDAERLDRRLAN